MALDKYIAEKRRFARLLGTDGRLGSGLPMSAPSSPQDAEDAGR
ncbi:hypothetical protein OB919_16975 [Halobacteria archaeon AArc-curdl1]|uniref:Uncharacterized protein n=1 Tax=Natronosalvus hydrolyticus TaxID=2979988 RepID=A0AAP3E7I6_9EURY|nr:hypothetical protein [Halobacteria archaeon AArc-curdl1]